MPKAVMTSHDNYTFGAEATMLKLGVGKKYLDGNGRILSYLPLSHAAAQCVDLLCPLKIGAHLFFADPSVLQGTMLKYLLVARPYLFLYKGPCF